MASLKRNVNNTFANTLRLMIALNYGRCNFCSNSKRCGVGEWWGNFDSNGIKVHLHISFIYERLSNVRGMEWESNP